jgi:hypothetical protein
MSLATEVTALKANLTTQASAIKASFARKVQAAFVADNALLLGGLSKDQLVALAQQHTDAHAQLVNNPHGTSAADLSMYTTAQIQALVAGLVPTGVIPLTQLGNPDTAVPLGATVNTSRVVAFVATPLFMAGGSYTLPVKSFLVVDGVLTYFYAQLVAGVPTWVMSTSYLPETLTNTLVGQVQVTNFVINKNTLDKVTRIDIYRISKTAAGSAIPVSLGDPSVAGSLAWK